MEKWKNDDVFDKKVRERFDEVMERLWSVHHSRLATLEIAETMTPEKRYKFYFEANENFNDTEESLWKYIEGETDSY